MHYKKYKSILSAKNGINLYRGCTHGCIYCDSRSSCYQINHRFEDIEVKEDAISQLEKELVKKRNKCMISTGAMCDPYIELEQELCLTRGMLELIYKYGFGCTLLTKSDRILRDIDIIKKINDNTKCVVQMTITTFDDSLCKKIEPNVSLTSQRFKVLEILKAYNIPTVVWIGPTLPYINDSEDNLLKILEHCKKVGVKGIMYFSFGVTLREGNRNYFYKALDKYFPDLKDKYIESYSNDYWCKSENSNNLDKIFFKFCEENNIIYKTKEVFEYLAEFPENTSQLSLF